MYPALSFDRTSHIEHHLMQPLQYRAQYHTCIIVLKAVFHASLTPEQAVFPESLKLAQKNPP
jgi:hypothetical protein